MIKNTIKNDSKRKISGVDTAPESPVTTFGKETRYSGFLKFKDTLCIRGIFKGTIEGQGSLIVEKGAVVEVDHVSVVSLIVEGTVRGSIIAVDKVDMLPGSVVQGDVTANRLRIADGVVFEGQCSMTDKEDYIEIFSRPNEEIKAELRRSSALQ
ncbi:MAG TPA: polymer-forming cytoskeletal protein [Treponema sp.]|jgi:cytoskeletal protein CcmA (bactofilin family)|uniref:bactofilin family protein n=1 Tax=Gracilinema caldarium TaxID=215591 RepID=UPI0026ECA7C8|nr:polymer-forming cytoskeletal protein [Gracilinema caldarium]HPC71802.1 polymer-forming cytoskeletal protein [Treponema sp.]HRS03933.1 polymer-forming cytoskeletal protein [Treponema sp.]